MHYSCFATGRPIGPADKSFYCLQCQQLFLEAQKYNDQPVCRGCSEKLGLRQLHDSERAYHSRLIRQVISEGIPEQAVTFKQQIPLEQMLSSMDKEWVEQISSELKYKIEPVFDHWMSENQELNSVIVKKTEKILELENETIRLREELGSANEKYKKVKNIREVKELIRQKGLFTDDTIKEGSFNQANIGLKWESFMNSVFYGNRKNIYCDTERDYMVCVRLKGGFYSNAEATKKALKNNNVFNHHNNPCINIYDLKQSGVLDEITPINLLRTFQGLVLASFVSLISFIFFWFFIK